MAARGPPRGVPSHCNVRTGICLRMWPRNAREPREPSLSASQKHSWNGVWPLLKTVWRTRWNKGTTARISGYWCAP